MSKLTINKISDLTLEKYFDNAEWLNPHYDDNMALEAVNEYLIQERITPFKLLEKLSKEAELLKISPYEITMNFTFKPDNIYNWDDYYRYLCASLVSMLTWRKLTPNDSEI